MSTERAVSWHGADSLGRLSLQKAKVLLFEKAQALFLYVYQIQYLVYRKQFIEQFSKPTRYVVLQGLPKNLWTQC